ncbi:LysM peptidoglycan-binding domain-containing M23 family metallopeptidase [Brunnivagina elsteri]|uniref:Peptidase n=1 Tax=Brunnivagina elsteri CCALA 953 TaxID=987040 RepID=A0A2A2TQ18_9CYAN|nr:M23 family metallopeptidase [Calothrix elsteri]PAX60626.1 peptidase [Calothrix elsteri CCALA 953]
MKSSFTHFPLSLLLLASTVGIISTILPTTSAQKTLAQTVSSCPTSALSRFLRHTVSRGETLDSIAQQYSLTKTAIATMNPGLQNRGVVIGKQILIPPYNGIIIEVPRNQTWRDIAKRYKIRADVLFEVNGCQKNPRFVFVPDSNRAIVRTAIQSAPLPASNSTPTKFANYPLADVTNILLAYGWQTNPKTGEVFFHSGIDILAPVGTPVNSISEGVVAFADTQGTYGNLVIINHGSGLQSRYAQLETIKVAVGQEVKPGDVIGTVGTSGKPTSMRSHLHFEIRTSSDLGWVAKKPQDYFK